MKIKENSYYDIIAVTSMGVRMTPIDRQPIHISNCYSLQATSAESNVLNISSSLGLKAKVLTKFVEDSSIATFIKGELRKRNIEFESNDIKQGGPWGYRHQFNIADSGYGVRGPYVLNDRAGEVGRLISADDFNLDEIFTKQGCKIMHISGLIAALSDQTSRCCLEIAKYAKDNGTIVSFDLNYRESFWVNRKDELSKIFKEIASISDILIGNEEDFQLALGIEGPEVMNGNLTSKIDGFKEMIERVKISYPNTSVFATTLREVVNANKHMWGGVMLVDDNWYIELPREIEVLDRIGGGDGFVGGMLYGILKNMNEDTWLKFGWATGALATTMLEDYASPVSESQIWSIYEGNARVKR